MCLTPLATTQHTQEIVLILFEFPAFGSNLAQTTCVDLNLHVAWNEVLRRTKDEPQNREQPKHKTRPEPQTNPCSLFICLFVCLFVRSFVCAYDTTVCLWWHCYLGGDFPMAPKSVQANTANAGLIFNSAFFVILAL